MNRIDRPAARQRGCAAIFIASLTLLAGICQAQSEVAPRSAHATAESLWLAASDHTLDRMRGGFDLGAGLMVSFGISRALSINGQLISATSFQLGDLSRLTPAQAATLGQQMTAQMQVVQNGSGNTLASPNPAAMPTATLIQNTLNNQAIRNLTIIDAASNGMGLVKGLNLRATIDEAIANAIGTR